MRLSLYVLLVFVGFMTFSSCEESSIMLDESNVGFEYYPVEQGKFWLYRVDSTLVPGPTMDNFTSTSFIREEITDSFINSQGDTTFILQRSISDTRDGVFRTTDRWTIEKTESTVIRVEENLQFLKIVFPVTRGDVWQGNRFDERTTETVAQNIVEVYKAWESEVLNKAAMINANGVAYTDVLEIQHADFETEIELRQAKEYYAPGVGMILRELSILDTQCFAACAGDPWIEKAERGFELRQELLEHN